MYEIVTVPWPAVCLFRLILFIPGPLLALRTQILKNCVFCSLALSHVLLYVVGGAVYPMPVNIYLSRLLSHPHMKVLRPLHFYFLRANDRNFRGRFDE